MNLRMTAAVALVFSLAMLAVAAPAPIAKTDRNRTPDDRTIMQGTWKMVEQGRPGMNARLRVNRGGRGDFSTKIRIEGDKFQYLQHNGQDYVPSTTYDMKLDTRTTPRAIDLTYGNGDFIVAMKGIYKIEGKKLTLVYVQRYESKVKNISSGDQERPTSFDNTPGNAMQMVLERE